MATHVQEKYEVNVRAIDVGFSLKLQNKPVVLPIKPCYKIRYDDQNNEPSLVEGDYTFVRYHLSVAGYNVKLKEDHYS